MADELKASTFSYMQGHQNDPLGAAVAYETIQAIKDDDLIERSEKKGEIFLSQLNSLSDNDLDHVIVVEIRGRGLMFAIELASDKITNEIFKALIESGYIVCNRGSYLRIDPPLIINENEFREFMSTLTNIITSKINFT